MGLRGPGARRLQLVREAAEDPKYQRPPAWAKKGLSRAERVVSFLESLPITKGKREGRKMKLLPGQRHFVENVYGTKRHVRIAVKSEARGNGKSGLVAALCCCHLFGPEAEPRGEIYSAAVDRTQSGKLFSEIEAIILACPQYAARINCQRFHKRIEVLEGLGVGSIYEALSADARKGHGLAPSLWIFDELAQVPDRQLLDALMTAMGKRKRSLGIIISTQAPNDDHALSQIIDDGSSGADPSALVDLTTAPVDADPFDPATIRACNPAFGVFLDEGDVMAEAERARRLPSFEPAFRNLRLNQRVDAAAEHRVVTLEVWRACEGYVDPITLAGRVCYGGLDLSGTQDLTALVLAFPRDSGGYNILPRFWTPAGQLEQRRPAERDLFKQWIKAGFLTPIPGPTIRTSVIARALAEMASTYKIKAIGYDRWRIKFLQQDLADEGLELPLEEFGQGYKDMTPAIEYFAELALTGGLHHGGHPVLTASVAAAITVSDAAGNQKIDKEKSNARSSVRVDGAVALAMALGTARRHTREEQYTPAYQMLFA